MAGYVIVYFWVPSWLSLSFYRPGHVSLEVVEPGFPNVYVSYWPNSIGIGGVYTGVHGHFNLFADDMALQGYATPMHYYLRGLELGAIRERYNAFRGRLIEAGGVDTQVANAWASLAGIMPYTGRYNCSAVVYHLLCAGQIMGNPPVGVSNIGTAMSMGGGVIAAAVAGKIENGWWMRKVHDAEMLNSSPALKMLSFCKQTTLAMLAPFPNITGAREVEAILNRITVVKAERSALDYALYGIVFLGSAIAIHGIWKLIRRWLIHPIYTAELSTSYISRHEHALRMQLRKFVAPLGAQYIDQGTYHYMLPLMGLLLQHYLEAPLHIVRQYIGFYDTPVPVGELHLPDAEVDCWVFVPVDIPANSGYDPGWLVICAHWRQGIFDRVFYLDPYGINRLGYPVGGISLAHRLDIRVRETFGHEVPGGEFDHNMVPMVGNYSYSGTYAVEMTVNRVHNPHGPFVDLGFVIEETRVRHFQDAVTWLHDEV